MGVGAATLAAASGWRRPGRLRKTRRRDAVLPSFLLWLILGGAAFGCGGADRCILEGTATDGEAPWGYYVAEPAGWDGTSPLPLVVYFHGWNGTGAAAMEAANLSDDFTDRGWLFVAADGRQKTWAHRGSPAHGDAGARDEHAYVRALLDDVADRYPIDPRRRLAAGFSQGGSMVWDLACFQPDWFTAFAPVAGAFWNPLPDACAPGPRQVRHVHGTADGVVPYAGRPIGERWHQGDVGDSLALLAMATGCAADPVSVPSTERLPSCQRLAMCAPETAIVLCLHDGGHRRPDGWVAETIDWVGSVSDSH